MSTENPSREQLGEIVNLTTHWLEWIHHSHAGSWKQPLWSGAIRVDWFDQRPQSMQWLDKVTDQLVPLTRYYTSTSPTPIEEFVRLRRQNQWAENDPQFKALASAKENLEQAASKAVEFCKHFKHWAELKLEEPESAGAMLASKWSEPNGITEWAKVFRVSYGTMKSWLKAQQIKNRQISERRYVVAIEDLPCKPAE